MYVGVSKNPERRFIAHKSQAKNGKKKYHLQNAMAQHVNNIDDVFELNIIQYFSSVTEAFLREELWIAYLKGMGIVLYNETDGGEYPPVMFGKDNPFYGRHHSDETKTLLSIANTGRFSGDKNYFYGKRFLGNDHPLFGTKRPQNVLDALSKTHKNKVIPEELKMRWSLSHKNKQIGEDNPMFGKTGELNPNHGITDSLAKEIYAMYHTEGMLVKQIVKLTGINKSTVDRVIYSRGRFKWTKDLKI